MTACLLLLSFVVACGGETESETTGMPNPDEPMTVAENQPLSDDARAMTDKLAEVRPLVSAEYAPVGTLIDPEAPFGQHDQNVNIPLGDLPPRGGIHHPAWQSCGIYYDPVDPKHAVHSMEHGAVWVTYSPDLSARVKAVLTNKVGVDPFLLLSPYPGLRSPIVLTAWGLQLEVENADDERILEFIEAFRNGIQSPEPGATCTGGVSTTIQQ